MNLFKTVPRTKRTFLAVMLCIVSVMAFLPTSCLVYGAPDPSYVHGVVVDEEGASISGVTVELVLGDVVNATAVTNQSGYFGLTAEYGVYNLTFRKTGYIQVTHNVTLGTPDTDMNTTMLVRVLRLSTSIVTIIANPGDKVSIPFTTQNIGEETEAVEFSASKPEHWTARILTQGFEVGTVNIASGQSTSCQLEVTVPSTAAEDQNYDVSVTATVGVGVSLNFTVMIRSQPTAVVSGRVVDEDDNGMQGVTVSAYTFSEQLVESVATNSNGNFTMDLPTDSTLSIKVSKVGYVKATKSVTVQSTGEQNDLGEIVLANAISLSASTTSTLANPGDLVRLPFSLYNLGETTETVELSTTEPSGWSPIVTETFGVPADPVDIAPGTPLTYYLQVMVPNGAEGTTAFTVTASGETTDTLTFNINVETSAETMLSCQFPGKSTIPGNPVTFTVQLTNTFSTQKQFAVTVDSLPTNWTASVTVDSEYVTDIILGSGDSVALTVTVKSPVLAVIGQEYGFNVNVESDDQTLESLALAVSLHESDLVEEIVVTTKFPEVTVEAGQVVQYQITVANMGPTRRLLFLSVAAPPDWKAVFKSGDLEVSRLDLFAESFEDLTIEVTPPSTANLSTYDLPVQVKSESGVVLSEVELKATILGSYAMELMTPSLLITTTSGDSITFAATIYNTGFTSLTALNLTIEAEEGWTVTVTPTQVDLVRPQESVTFNVVVDTPSDTLSNDYLVTLTGHSEQTTSSSVQVRVTVSTPTEWGLAGIGVAIAIVILLILVFRKFKRR